MSCDTLTANHNYAASIPDISDFYNRRIEIEKEPVDIKASQPVIKKLVQKPQQITSSISSAATSWFGYMSGYNAIDKQHITTKHIDDICTQLVSNSSEDIDNTSLLMQLVNLYKASLDNTEKNKHIKRVMSNSNLFDVFYTLLVYYTTNINTHTVTHKNNCVKLIVKILCYLSEHEVCRVKISASQSPKILLQLMTTHIKDSELCMNICCIISSFFNASANYKSGVNPFLSREALDALSGTLFNVLSNYSSNYSFVNICSSILSELMRLDVDNNTGAISACHDGCEIVVDILSKLIQKSLSHSLSGEGCSAAVDQFSNSTAAPDIASREELLDDMLVNTLVCHASIDSLEEPSGEENVTNKVSTPVELTLQCIGNVLYCIGMISRQHVANQLCLGELHVCTVIIDYLHQIYHDTYGSTVERCSSFPKVLQSCLVAVTYLSMECEVHQNRFIIPNGEKYGGQVPAPVRVSSPSTQSDGRKALGGIMMRILVEYTEKETVSLVKWCYHALHNLSHKNNDVHAAFAELRVAKNVFQSVATLGNLKSKSDCMIIAQWGWYVLSTLVSYDANMPVLATSGICDEAVTALEVFGSKQEIVKWICVTVVAMVREKDCRLLLLSANMCKTLAQIVFTHNHWKCSSIAQDCCCILGQLACTAIAIDKSGSQAYSQYLKSLISLDTNDLLADTKMASVVVKSMELYVNDIFVIEQAVYATYALATDLDVCCASLVKEKIFKVIPLVVSSSFNSIPSIAYYCFRLYYELCMKNRKYNIILGNGGWDDCISEEESVLPICVQLCTMVAMHMKDAEVCLWGLRACTIMGNENRVNVGSFMKGHMHQIAVRVLSYHDHSNVEICIAANELICVLCSNGFSTQVQIGNVGGCEACMNVVKIHPDHKDLVVSTARAICALSAGCKPNNEKCGVTKACGVLEWCMDAMVRFSEEEEVLVALVNVLGVLTETNRNCAKMGPLGACEAVLDCLNRNPNSAALSVAGCNTIGCMSLNPAFNHEQFAKAGACEMIVRTMKLFRDVESISKWACRAIYRLGEGHSAHRKIFADAGGCSELIKIFCLHASSAEVSEQCCLAVSILVEGNDANAKTVVDEGVCACLVACMISHSDVSNVVLAACKMICAVSVLYNSELGAAGVCESLMAAFKKHARDEGVVRWCCKAISALALNPSNQESLGRSKACEEVTNALHNYAGTESIFAIVILNTTPPNDPKSGSARGLNVEIALDGLCAILHLSANNATHTESFANLGACEAITCTFQRYQMDEEVVVAACKAICMLCKVNTTVIAARFGHAGVCSTLVEALSSHPGSEQVAGNACRTIKFLAQSKDVNVPKLTSAGACETVPVAMQAHQTSICVASAGCGALAVLASSTDNVKRMGYSGACEAIVFCLKKHWTNDRLVERASRALARLALDEGNSAWLGPAGACEAVMHAQEKHQMNSYISAAAFGAMGNLANDPNNRSRLVDAGCCPAVVEAMERHKDCEDVIRMCARCIAKLALTPENKAVLYEAGECKHLVRGFKSFPSSSQLILQLCKTIKEIASNDQQVKTTLGELQCVGELVSVLATHQNKDVIVASSCYALSELCADHTSNQHQCVNTGIITMLQGIIQAYFSSDLCADAVCCATGAVVHNNPTNIKKFIANNMLSQLLKLLARHNRSSDIFAYHCIKSMKYLIQMDPKSAFKLMEEGKSGGSNAVANNPSFAIYGSANRGNMALGLGLGGLGMGLGVTSSSVNGTNSMLQEQLVLVGTKYGVEDGAVDGLNVESFVIDICQCLISLCSDQYGLYKLVSAGVIRLVSILLQKHCNGSPEVMLMLCKSVIALCLYKDREVQLKLGQAGVCKSLSLLLDGYINVVIALRQKKLKNKKSSRRRSVERSGSGTPVTDNTADYVSTVNTPSEQRNEAEGFVVAVGDTSATHEDHTRPLASTIRPDSPGVTPGATRSPVTVSFFNSTEIDIIESCCQAVLTLIYRCEANATRFNITDIKNTLSNVATYMAKDPSDPVHKLCKTTLTSLQH